MAERLSVTTGGTDAFEALKLKVCMLASQAESDHGTDGQIRSWKLCIFGLLLNMHADFDEGNSATHRIIRCK